MSVLENLIVAQHNKLMRASGFAIGGLLGLGIAWFLSQGISQAAGGFLPPIILTTQVWLAGLAAIIVLSLAVGLMPALRARRLRIVDALAGR